EKYVADPPRASCTLPKGVSTLSSATEPTTRRSVIVAGSHCSGDREAGLDRGWPAVGACRLRSRGLPFRPPRKYGSSSNSSFFLVAAGKARGFVITAFRSRLGHSHVREGAIAGITRRRTSLAVSTFFRRFWTTASTDTASCVSCQTS